MNIMVQRLPLLLIAMLALSLGNPVLAQQRGGERGGDRGGDRGGERGGERGGDRQRWEDMSEEEREEMRERMRERMAEREEQQAEQLRERLEMSEEDFELIAPMINNVRTLVREQQMINAGGRGTAGQRGGGGFALELSDEGQAVSDAMAELREAIEDDDSGDMKDALAKLRTARAAHDKLLSDAREELRSICTAKWEAEFVVMGLLD